MGQLKETLRLALARTVAVTLRLRSFPLQAIRGPIVVVAPHPDDETLGCGGLIARQAAASEAVHVVFLTAGEASHRGHPHLRPEAVAAQRRAEAVAALAILTRGAPLASVEHLALPDGALDALPANTRAAAIERLEAKLRDVKPIAVLAPFHAGGSSEHTAACELVVAAMTEAGGGWLFEYPIWAWWNALRLRRRVWHAAENLRLSLGAARDLKRRALAVHRTQVEPSSPWTEPLLPPALAAACCGPNEYYFRRRVVPG